MDRWRERRRDAPCSPSTIVTQSSDLRAVMPRTEALGRMSIDDIAGA